jgi:hypothetical protein
MGVQPRCDGDCRALRQHINALMTLEIDQDRAIGLPFSVKRSVRRAYGATTADKRSVKMRCEHCGTSQANFCTRSCNRALLALQGRSAIVRMYDPRMRVAPW